MTNDDFERLAALGHQLIATHQRLLDALDDLREGGHAASDLATHCLAFCTAVTRHHTEEDTTVFPLLAERHPELRAVLEGLARDHVIVSGMLARAGELAVDLDADGARAELDGLAPLLESHFAWEEKRLVNALNALAPGELVPRW